MSVKFFRNLPIIDYGSQKARNLMLNARLTKELLDKYGSYYAYTIKEGETPTMIAYDYYGSVDYVWLVLLSNDFVDPYHDWYKTPIQFDDFIRAKYGSIEEAMSLLLHYQNPEKTYLMTPTTFSFASASERQGWEPVYAFDYELELNERKKEIQLLSLEFAPRVAAELEKIFR